MWGVTDPYYYDMYLDPNVMSRIQVSCSEQKERVSHKVPDMKKSPYPGPEGKILRSGIRNTHNFCIALKWIASDDRIFLSNQKSGNEQSRFHLYKVSIL